MNQTRPARATGAVAASHLNNGRSPASSASERVADPQRDLLIHDIRTPLTAISGYAQLLLRRRMTGNLDVVGLDDGLRRIEEAALRVGQLLDHLTDFPAQSGANGSDDHRELIDLVHLARCIAEESQAAALRRSHVEVLSAVPDLVGWWNAACLERMLANLIDNSLKYNRDDASVVVTIRCADGWAVVSVADRGVGIPAAELARVFDCGYRASNVSGCVPGSGLGLAGAQRTVAAHGGTISLESRLGSGTTVTVRLPLGGPTPC